MSRLHKPFFLCVCVIFTGVPQETQRCQKTNQDDDKNLNHNDNNALYCLIKEFYYPSFFISQKRRIFPVSFPCRNLIPQHAQHICELKPV